MGMRALLGMDGVARIWGRYPDRLRRRRTSVGPTGCLSSATVTIPPPSSALLLPQGDLEYLSCIRWKKKWNRRELCYCIWNLPEKFPLSSSWKIVFIWNMKHLPNLLSQRPEWKMMLFGFQVELLELVGVYGQPGLSVEISPCASKLQIYISPLAASPTKICL